MSKDLTSNGVRAERAGAVLYAYWQAAGDTYDPVNETTLSDLLADLLHWANGEGISFDDALARGRMHYEAELIEPDMS
jgi:hypothetical protein